MAQAHSNHYLLVPVAVVVAAFLLAAGDASSSVGFDLHHRFSPVVRQWAEARGHPLAAEQWPARGTPEYYSALCGHDRAHLARRALAGGADGLLTFAAGNDTLQYIGSLYYAEVELGTPNATFLVALDTGSDLFWVPCDCKQCASIANATGGQDAPELRPYSPRRSTTSTPVTCDNALCDARRTDAACGAATNGSCPYEVRYVSANTSSSGVLVQDVVHLTRERPGGAAGEALQAAVVFGCGQVQTGAFLDGGGFDGLMGLGMGKVSVPSVLAASGLVASDSFSMCFGDDGVGRINFGDAGGRDQAETPFTVRSTHPTYNVSFTSINVGNKSVAAEFAAVMDSGTSFTYLSDPEYTELATNFSSQIRERRVNFSTGSADPFPFEYCYRVSPNQTEALIPDVSLTTKGGALFPVTQPFVVLFDAATRRAVGYCLAIIKNDLGIINLNIIGQNFMTGLKVVFDRERSVLGWEKFDCYKNARVAAAPDGSPCPSPAPAAGPTKITPLQNDGGSSGYPGAAPLPTSAGSSRNAATLGVGGLYLLLLLAAALV